ncbi:28S ribosomal protein S29, mitochondrial [Habropoda laboriosa]|uniref:Small ribosomal subunit protein mS29 n=1 Tax=Habropoda laboriosa TaxID=597456 RepID=A0A0L7R213_9HYME|nr:28S ribosomal protein S29, mitochondrial [Habropoda laboriosa]
MCIINGRRTVITAAAKEIQDTNISPFRVMESYPPEHDKSHLNRIYTVPETVTTLLTQDMSKELKKQITVFNEFGILIRKPAIELMSYLEQTDYTKPINKYVLYGKLGVGKTTILMHLIHYGLEKHFIMLHLPWVATWFRFPRKVVQSTTNPDQLDLPEEAALWLRYFKQLNELSLSQYDVSKEYVWTQREMTKSGESLSHLIEFGIERNRFACAVITALIDELKAASIAGKCKILVVIDGFNAFTSKCTLVRDENRVFVPPSRVSITSAFFNIVNYDWCNGAAILTVDVRANKDRKESDYPIYLLGKEGFEYLDPYLPVCVENYSREEFKTIIEYYKDRKWIRNISPEAEKELELLSNKNPLELWQCSKPI